MVISKRHALKRFIKGKQGYGFINLVLAYATLAKDIIFPKDYLEKVNRIYEDDPKAGMVSGLVYIKDNDGNWTFENISCFESVWCV